MKTRSAKAARKRGGQNKREDAVRYPSGRIDYAATSRREDVMAVAKAQRVRHPGVVAGNANSATAGTVLGRMLLQGELSEAQYKAGREFERRRSAYLRAIQAPKPTRSGSDIGYIHETIESAPTAETVFRAFDADGTSDEYVQRCEAARLQYEFVRHAALNADPLGLMALEAIICDDRMVEMLVGPLRVACNRLAREFKIGAGG